MYYSIAIDGPSASGKSSVSKLLAKKLNINHLSSGALYRAIAYYLIQNNINENLVENYLNQIEIKVKFKNFHQLIFLNNEDITDKLQTNEISTLSSIISQNKAVREFVKEIQINVSENQNIIIDGRDIASVVLPNSKYKFFITASIKARAKRRYLDYKKKIPLRKIEQDIKTRDERDVNRDISPLIKTKDAILINSSNLTLEETVDKILNYIKEN
ncbi:MAG: (d)CMP kinase [Clostridiales bacterium]|nr:(d)CMP kinase [Clostridiales bacterium]